MNLKKEHEDFRGEIWTLTDTRIGEMTILFTNAGYARGGCMHDQEELLYVIEGSVIVFQGNEYWSEGERMNKYSHDSPVIIPIGQPHGFKSITDSVVMEIKSLDIKTEHDSELRKKIQEINDVMEASK